MNYPDHSSRMLNDKVTCCATRLRLISEADRWQKAELALLTDSFEDLALSCLQPTANNIKRIAERIYRYLQYRIDCVLPVATFEAETLNRAAGWLEQLGRMHVKELPIPEAMLTDLLYSFDLLENIIHARNCDTGNNPGVKPCAGDLFSEDPELVASEADCENLLDPFAEDPDVGTLQDLLQRAVHYADESITTPMEDPFGDDELLSVAESEIPLVNDSPRALYPADDLFADDPQLEDSK